MVATVGTVTTAPGCADRKRARFYAPCVRIVPESERQNPPPLPLDSVENIVVGKEENRVVDDKPTCSLDDQGQRLVAAYDNFVATASEREGKAYQCVDLEGRGFLSAVGGDDNGSDDKKESLAGRSVRVLWPDDQAWYLGQIQTWKGDTFTVVYEDGTKEDLETRQEKIRLALRPLELLWSPERFSPSCCVQGDLVWAKMKGYPPWPARVVTAEEFEVSSGQKLRSRTQICFSFFGTYDYGQTASVDQALFAPKGGGFDPAKPNAHKIPSKPYDIWRWSDGVRLEFHLKYKSSRFRRAVAEAKAYLAHNEMPDAMVPFYNEPGLLEDDDEAEVVKPSKRGKVCNISTEKSFKVGKNLHILNTGTVERSDPRFHDAQYIYPIGYESRRTVQEPGGSPVSVECRIERAPLCEGGGPRFRVTIRGEGEKSNISACEATAQRAFQRLEEASAIKRQIYSGHKLFGYSVTTVQRQIERLPGATWCDNYSPLDEEHWKSAGKVDRADPLEAYQVARARRMWNATAQCPASLGFNPVCINLPPNCCAICNTDKETDVNELIQCDSCKALVHMGCYGVQEQMEMTKMWVCDLCQCLRQQEGQVAENNQQQQENEQEAPRPACALCPCVSDQQILSRTTCGQWAHRACAIWIPETTINGKGEIDGVKKIRPARMQLSCDLCKTDRGPCIQCTFDKKCYSASHPLCARAAGWKMTIKEDKTNGIRLESVCLKCQAKQRVGSGTKKRKTSMAEAKPREEAVAAAVTREEEEDPSPPLARDASGGCSRIVPQRDLRAMSALAGSARSVPYVVSGARGIPARISGKSNKSPVASVSARLDWARNKHAERIAAGRSPIHGWGVFARAKLFSGDFVIEYCGEVLRLSVANRREERVYGTKVGIGTYIFRVDNHTVIDATERGNMAQLLNHSCDPNCFSRPVGRGRVVLSALRDILPGEELTYDYRFSGDETLVCKCGSAKCRGTVNIRAQDGEEDNDNLV